MKENEKKTIEKRMQRFLAYFPKISELQFLKKISQEEPGAEIFLVGGSVRDIALGKKSIDYDLVVRGVSKKEVGGMLAKFGKVNLAGKRFGVFKFTPHEREEIIDIALPRTEHAFKTGGYKDVKVHSDHTLPIKTDLSRRDFTINAMALRLIPPYPLSPLIDPFNGKNDLIEKKIRAVGNPKERFREDYSRMLRALRFSIQHGYTIEENTYRAIQEEIKNINTIVDGEFIVPREVIAKELIKMFEKNPFISLKLLDESTMIKLLMPEFLKMKGCPQPKQFHAEGDVWKHTLLALEKLSSKQFQKEFQKSYKLKAESYKLSSELVWSLLFHDLGKPYTIVYADRIRFDGHNAKSKKLFLEIADRLCLASAGLDVQKTAQLISQHMFLTHGNIGEMRETTIEKYFFSAQFPGKELLMHSFADISATIPASGKPDYSRYQELKKRIAALQKKTKTQKKLPKNTLNGHEIMAILGLKPGKEVGKIKEWLREEQLKGKIRTKKQARKFIKKHSQDLPLRSRRGWPKAG